MKGKKMNDSKHEPMPKPGKKSVLIDVMTDLLHRDQIGRKKYGTSLKTFNGRNGLKDAYQEALDMVMYLKQCLLEVESKKESEAADIQIVIDDSIHPGETNIIAKIVDEWGETLYECAPFRDVQKGEVLTLSGLRFDADFIDAVKNGKVRGRYS